MTELTTETFDNFISKNELAFVDFWADWCRPCLTMAPELEIFAAAKPDIAIGKVNINDGDNATLAQKFDVRTIPNFVLFKDGTLIGSISGAQTSDSLLEKVSSLLGDEND
ncbi:thioredoxin [Candidatus Saccharibacteria bacterium]|nr:MAG: thioredoxin [Candidatus Saccharibacteria bacterium]